MLGQDEFFLEVAQEQNCCVLTKYTSETSQTRSVLGSQTSSLHLGNPALVLALSWTARQMTQFYLCLRIGYVGSCLDISPKDLMGMSDGYLLNSCKIKSILCLCCTERQKKHFDL